jgi:hypothetical protein
MWRSRFRFFGLAGACPCWAVRLAVPAGVGFGDGEAEGFELGDELAQALVTVEPGLSAVKSAAVIIPARTTKSRR